MAKPSQLTGRVAPGPSLAQAEASSSLPSAKSPPAVLVPETPSPQWGPPWAVRRPTGWGRPAPEILAPAEGTPPRPAGRLAAAPAPSSGALQRRGPAPARQWLPHGPAPPPAEPAASLHSRCNRAARTRAPPAPGRRPAPFGWLPPAPPASPGLQQPPAPAEGPRASPPHRSGGVPVPRCAPRSQRRPGSLWRRRHRLQPASGRPKR
mmetsp:Transcript_7521/g.18023  ORF Transcript_7521/g.18023 Transcript_7521/m.18023 type:complete len:207 (+) Transcript_7521:41-661(+)